jgi:exonuclease SbcC
MKILQTADWHIGTFRGPIKDGVNLRTEDTKRCLDEMIKVAREERPDYSLISGDVFHVGRLWSDRCCEEIITAIHYIKQLAAVSKQVVVMRGTPNHDGAGQFDVLTAMFKDCPNVHIVTTPQIISFDDVDIAVLPGFDRGAFRAKFPGISKEDENDVFTKELSNIVLGLKAQCNPNKQSVLMSHYTVPGCNTESGQVMVLTQFEPIIPQEALLAADYDLVALGHIHRPQQIASNNWYYSGAINAMNFNDEGQERGFWVHDCTAGLWQSKFHNTPIREFITLEFTDTDITAINLGNIDAVADNFWRWNDAIRNKIVRIRYSCTAKNNKALNKAVLEKTLLNDGAFMVWEILPDKVDEFANRTELSNTTDPEANLVKYLEEKQFPPEKIQELVLKARPIIAEAEASVTTVANTGTFEPVEISVKNYRNYEEETFNFEDISFCTINGQNGAGKSSLFMDAIIDCIYEEPREGFVKSDDKRPVWLRDDEKARSGYIMFTFRIGKKLFRITRTRTRSGSITLNVSEFVDGEWQDQSKERVADTQQEILNIVGMDSLTFKSCALIMQDQYGLFLQAKPEERVEVLGTLLGLGVYQIMERISADKGKVFGANTRELQKEVEIHNSTIISYGNPDEELNAHKAELANYESALQAKMGERDRNNLLLTHQQEAVERHSKLMQSITTLQAKKALAEQNRATQQAIIDSSSIILENRQKIESMVAEYNSMIEKEVTLARESALYTAKKREVEAYASQASEEQAKTDSLKVRLKQRENELSLAMRATDQEALIRSNAAEYDKYVVLLHSMQELQMKYTEALAVRSQKAYAVDSKRAYINQEEHRFNARKAELEHRIELLQNSGCVDSERATCRFLSDAIEAKKQLPIVENEIASFMQEQNELEEKLTKELEEANTVVFEIGFDEIKLLEYKEKVSQLSGASEALRKLEGSISQIAIIQADIEHLQSNILEADKRLIELKLKGKETERECDRYANAFDEHVKVQNSILVLKPWLEKEKQLPVAEERKATATSRLLELSAEISGIDMEITEKQAEAEKAFLTLGNAEELKTVAIRLEAEVNALNAVVKEHQMKIGALQQKAEQIATLKKEIVALQEQQTEYAKETADYDALKVAFGQSGVPHQIIRSIIPQLTATSNSILGQMTGGKMGVEFKLERLMKNGKEKCSLDILIEEYGKAALPYLSKSGGEKVKSSLSVILSLAEIKSSSAGIQLGMLFIDEPPFLDGDGIQAYCDALETIQSRYKDIKIMAITHDPTMKARFPQNLDVVKTERGSKVIY